MNSKKLKKFLIALCCIIVVILFVEVILVTKGIRFNDKVINSRYFEIKFPKEYVEYLVCDSIEQNGYVEERFSMKTDNDEVVLFSIYCGDKDGGDILGYIKNENELLAISIEVVEYTENYLATIEDIDLFYGMRSCINKVIDSIFENENYVEYPGVTDITNSEHKLKYWKVNLPDGIIVDEVETAESYTASFSTVNNGEQIKLYQISLDGNPLAEVLGTYTLNGKEKTVFVETFELPAMDNWKEKDINTVYTMMGSINDVIQVIMSSDNFTQSATFIEDKAE